MSDEECPRPVFTISVEAGPHFEWSDELGRFVAKDGPVDMSKVNAWVPEPYDGPPLTWDEIFPGGWTDVGATVDE